MLDMVNWPSGGGQSHNAMACVTGSCMLYGYGGRFVFVGARPHPAVHGSVQPDGGLCLWCVGGTKASRGVFAVSLRCSATMGVFDVVIVCCVATLELELVRVDACVSSFGRTHRAIRSAEKMHENTMNIPGGRTTIITSVE